MQAVPFRGSETAFAGSPGLSLSTPPRPAKAVIANFRLLRETELSFTPKVTLCVGRNNTGKTSLAKLFKLFIARDHT
ncbi:AAA family ATPase [Streptomyces roseifaciens]